MWLSFGLLVLVIIVWQRWLRPPQYLRGLPHTSVVSTLYTFMTLPILDAMRKLHWPILFQTEVMTSWFLGDWWVLIGDPIIIKEILSDQSLAEKKLYTDSSPNALVGEYIGVNILYSKGEDWRRHRKVINPAFRQDWNPEIFARCCLTMLNQIPLEEIKLTDEVFRVDIHKLSTRMTLDALGEAVLGFKFNATQNPLSEYTVAYHQAATGVSNNLYFLFPFLENLLIPSRIRDRKAVRDFRSLAARIINEKRSKLNDDSSDLLTLMLQASDKESNLLSDEELINNTIIMFAAGHDTTTNTICYTLYHLCKHPDIQNLAREEIYRILGNPNQHTNIPTSSQASQMTYLDAISLECMRLTPSLPQMRRVLKKSYCLPNGVALPSGTPLLLQIYAAMNHPDYWTSPHQFQPGRFLNPRSSPNEPWSLNREAHRYFFGFGDGTRTCIGYQMSLLEQRITLAMILQSYHLKLPKHSIHHDHIITTKDQLCRPLNLEIDFIKIN